MREGKPYVFKEGDGWACSVGSICQKCGEVGLDRLADEVSWSEAIAAAAPSAVRSSPAPCEECGGSGRTVQGWTDKNGFSEDQYGPCRVCTPPGEATP